MFVYIWCIFVLFYVAYFSQRRWVEALSGNQFFLANNYFSSFSFINFISYITADVFKYVGIHTYIHQFYSGTWPIYT